MIGYKYNTEEEAKAGRKLCADYYGLPKVDNDTTLYWVDYSEASLNVPIFWYIAADSSISDILGETTEFEIIENELNENEN